MKQRDWEIAAAWNNMDVPAEHTAERFGYKDLKSLCGYITKQRALGNGSNFVYRKWNRRAA